MILNVFISADIARNANVTCDVISIVDRELRGAVVIYDAKHSDVTACLYQCQRRSECVTAQWHSSGICKLYDVSPRDASLSYDATAQLYEFLCEGASFKQRA